MKRLVGKGNRIFRMPKFRTMLIGTPAVATHLLADPQRCLTPVGGFLRKTSLDELPQIFTILTGDMSIVGPRPALFNQDDLIALRTAKGVHELTPGLTGWAQVNGRDELPIPVKVGFDEYYLKNRTLCIEGGRLGRAVLFRHQYRCPVHYECRFRGEGARQLFRVFFGGDEIDVTIEG